jgi:hypothetical protein
MTAPRVWTEAEDGQLMRLARGRVSWVRIATQFGCTLREAAERYRWLTNPRRYVRKLGLGKELKIRDLPHHLRDDYRVMRRKCGPKDAHRWLRQHLAAVDPHNDALAEMEGAQ